MNQVSQHPGLRIFVLGAGFSVPAGLPLAAGLFQSIKRRVEAIHGVETKFQVDIENYIEYRKRCFDETISEDDIDLEAFLSFLDIEHFLGLRGSGTWSDDGNESQVMVKRFLGQFIHDHTPEGDSLPDCYYEFARRLSTHDVVLTLNYDNVLERALEHVGKPYRLFPFRYSEIGRWSNTVDSSVDEVVILKLHGSLDWFSNRQYLRSIEDWRVQGFDGLPHNAIFNDETRFSATPIVDGPRSPDDPLNHVFRIRGTDDFYSKAEPLETPVILSPSHYKIVYATPLLDFWHGLGRSGDMNLGVSVIGFSLPDHDEYLRIALYQLITNYQDSWWDERVLDTLKDNVKFVDYQQDAGGIAEFKARYGFVDTEKTEYWWDGFGEDAVEFLFNPARA
ncbi:SIR2 family protein [Saccharospirillum alexandrii]|uniref:SIR2 family protein n=1 Tax=Saccharospirillum alexandrii TaxID=2448477 RepID=UPI000FDC4795|nr:SIR2 family protein [Saccharospirillum alexandrii]